jgi:Domain of unknown function (DUF4410)
MQHTWTVFLLVGLFCSTCAMAQEANTQSATQLGPPAVHAFKKNSIVYISDFELDAQNVKVDKGGVVGEMRPGVVERPRKREQRDPEVQAKKLVNQMSESLESDLRKSGYKVQRLAAGEARPATGVWVHGIFTEVDEGNQRRRAIIGFGAGEAKMDLYVTLTDLSHPDAPLYNLTKDDNSGKKISAVVTMNPYVAATKYVMEKNAPEKTVKKTAKEISEQIVKTLKQSETTAEAP